MHTSIALLKLFGVSVLIGICIAALFIGVISAAVDVLVTSYERN